jgi:L-alanine-DL-glutamate epimerase-like enolase superfamily enzyme
MPFPDALRLCKLCEPLNVVFFEEPVPLNDPHLLAELRRQTAVPLAANPSGYRWTYRELLTQDAADFVQPNVTQIGVTEAWKIAEMAQAFNRQIANGNGGGPHNLHLQAGVANGWGVEFHYHNWMLYQAVFQHVPAPRNGWVTAPAAPGFGLDPRPEVVQEYRQRPG